MGVVGEARQEVVEALEIAEDLEGGFAALEVDDG